MLGCFVLFRTPRNDVEGVVLGRPKGSKSARKKLTGREAEIGDPVHTSVMNGAGSRWRRCGQWGLQGFLARKISISAIGRLLGVHRLTVTAFIKEHPPA